MKLFENISFQKKNYMLLGLMLVFSVLVYKISISKTLSLAETCSELEVKINELKNSPQTLSRLNAELNSVEQLIGTGSKDAIEVQGELLDAINEYCQDIGVKVSEVYPIHQFSENDYKIITHTIKVEGDFTSLVKLNHRLETSFDQAKIRSVKYESIIVKKTKKKKLYATFYIQNIRKI